MKRKKFAIIIAVFVIILFCTTVNAMEYASVSDSKVILNGTQINNESREYPLLLYKDITYFPLTYYDCRYLGLVTEWSESTKTLSVEKENITGAYRDYNMGRKNDISNAIEICPFNIFVNGKSIDNTQEDYPFIMFRGVTYFPLTWHFAVDEFGWNYSYSCEDGLVINSTNRNMEKLNLPDMRKNNPSAATDGNYYYYTGTENRVFRVPCNDFSKREVIHTLEYTYYPDTTPVDFSFVGSNVYMSYHIGGASTGTNFRYKINGDGTIEKSNEGTHYTGGVGFNGYVIDGDGFIVERYNSGRSGTTSVHYKLDGTQDYIEIKKDGVVFGEYKDISLNLNESGTLLGTNEKGNVWFNDPQILGKAIYLTGYEIGSNKNSNLYRVDVITGNIEMVMENVTVFYAFYGWDTFENAMSEMVLYEMNGEENVLYRFSYLSKKMHRIGGYVPRLNRLKIAMGDIDLVAVFDDGKTSSVWCYDGYGIGSLRVKAFESNKGFDFNVDNGIMIGTSYYADDVKSIFLNNYHNFTKTCELVENVFVFENTVIMTIQNEDNTESFIVKMDMK